MKQFPIVGIGASAGGLEAFTRLLEHLPTETGLGFVLVQHLDPKHESALTDLLSRATRMPVREAVDGAAVEPNHVYIIPPNTDLTLSGGVLKVRGRQEGGPRRTVDVFLQSLAEDQGERAIGVILSGTASDGTFGLEAIKAEGGVTFAQDDSAKYDSMPRSAVAAGCVDFVLSPKDIAKELARIARHPHLAMEEAEKKPGGKAKRRRRPGAEAGAAVGPFRKIVFLLRSHTGVDFSLYKPATLQRRVNRRMMLLKLKTLDAYLNRLRGDAAERDALYQDVLISVTGFFRDPEAFKSLEKTVFPQILRHRAPDNPIRVWVPGCSTGQEAYSIAMALLENMGESARVPLQIYATDLNETSLEKARVGRYVKSLMGGVSPERLRRYFVQEEGAYRVSKSVREMCIFAKHNLISDPPFSRMDLIACRNLLIYLDSEAQKKIIPALHYALKPNGFLFLGASETTASFGELFAPVDKKNRIYSKKPGPSRPLNIPFSAYRPQAERPASLVRRPPEGREADVQKEADRVILANYAPPSALISEDLEVLQFWGATGPYFQLPSGKASMKLLKIARDGLFLPLRAAIAQARKENQRVRKANVRIDQNGRSRSADLVVIPLKNLKERYFLVFFEAARPSAAPPEEPASREAAPPPAAGRDEVRELARLKTELTDARDYLQSLQEQHEAASEELQASGEEVQSTNEELQSVNEELETSKEELESSNEELTTVNEEMANRNAELTTLTGDLNNLLASVDIAVLLLGRDLRLRRFTPPAERLFNLLASDVGRPFGAVKSNLEFPGLEQLLSDVIDRVSMQSREVRDKTGRWYFLRARPYLTPDNKVDGAVVTLVDINELKQSLRKNETMLDTAPPMLVLDPDLRVRKANRTFCEAFHVAAEETEGRLVYDLGNRQWDIPQLRTLLEDILPKKKALANFEVDHAFESIGPRSVLLNAREFEWGEPSGRAILLAFQDVTDRKTALKEIQAHTTELERRVRQRTMELSASNEELEAFCYSVAHDLRRPLRAIDGFSQVILNACKGRLDASSIGYFERIRSATQQMSLLIDSLLDLARLTRSETRHQEVDLSQLAGAVAEELRRKQPDREVEFAIAPGVMAVGDDRLLRIALENLFENAWKFTSKHPRARIEFGAVEKGGERVYFVRDDGAGFDMAYAEKLFQTFQRLHGTDEFPGTGIGLTIVQRIVQKHGGRIWADGAVEGGATFSFTLRDRRAPDRPVDGRTPRRRATDQR